MSSRRWQDEIEHQKKAETIVNTVLNIVDKDKDGRISLEEFQSIGLDGLPNFDELGAEGHHYDVESGTHPIAMSPFHPRLTSFFVFQNSFCITKV
jgi:hypothetical protein